MKRVRYTVPIGNTPSGTERTVSDSQYRFMLAHGLVELASESPEATEPPAAASDVMADPTPDEVRQWGTAYGLKIPARGKLARKWIDAYRDAHNMT